MQHQPPGAPTAPGPTSGTYTVDNGHAEFTLPHDATAAEHRAAMETIERARGLRLYHGGRPGLRVGDLIEYIPLPAGIAHPMPKWEGWVSATTSRIIAKQAADAIGLGDLYRVTPVGAFHQAEEFAAPVYRVAALRVAAIHDRAVKLTASEHRRYLREWSDYAAAAEATRG